MNEVRYWIALVMICLIPGTIAYWLSIHPFIAFWRRAGPARTLVLHFTLAAIIAAAVATQRRWLLAAEFGNQTLPAAAGICLLILAVIFRRKIGAELKVSTLIGLPELAPSSHPQPLITTGPYSVIRHPRYVQLLLALWGWTLLANYLSLYLLSALAVAAVWVLVRLEERELSRRYGPEWSHYAHRVPRFIPRFRPVR